MFGAISTISASSLFDRCDIIAREQKIVDQKMTGTDEQVVARDVHCLIKQSRGSRLATLLGFQQTNVVTGIFGPGTEIRAGWTIRVQSGWRSYRYGITSVEKHPAPHDFQFQVATLSQEIVETRA